MQPLPITAFTYSTCLGQGLAANLQALRSGHSGLVPCAFETVRLDTWIGVVDGVDRVRLPSALSAYDCRNNRLALLGLETDGFAERARQAIRRHGAARVGVFVGTSTSGILETEIAYRHRDPVTGTLPASLNYAGSHNPFSLAELTRRALGAEGMAMTISTACSSSAKVFAAAARQIASGTIDAAVVGGVDSLCLTTLYGFSSLQLTSSQPSKPFDPGRDGISIGEGAAFALLERSDDTAAADAAAWLRGTGEATDAYHMSAPHPEGMGARMAMKAALASARLEQADIDYINLHGTGTPANDVVEGRAVAALFGRQVPCSSTKGATGHTLGAAGAIEAIIAMQAAIEGWIPGSPGTDMVDPAIGSAIDYRRANQEGAQVRISMSNSFGFGGSNCVLVLGSRPS